MRTLANKDLDEIAIERLKMFEPPEGYWVAYSGGKDSDVILDLVRRSGVKYDAHHSLTTADPPEVVRHVKEQSDVEIRQPKETMWQLIRRKKMPPLRRKRYCCETQKESGGPDRLIITGVRWAESVARSKRRILEHCLKGKNRKFFHLIIDWLDMDVWYYIRHREINYCSLYDEGFKRLGCVLCPMSDNVERDMLRWPEIARAWERAIKATFRPDHPNIKHSFHTSEEYWQWWLSRHASVKDYEYPLFE